MLSMQTNKQNKSKIIAKNMHKTYKNYAQYAKYMHINMQKNCKIYAYKYARNMQYICKIYANIYAVNQLPAGTASHPAASWS